MIKGLEKRDEKRCDKKRESTPVKLKKQNKESKSQKVKDPPKAPAPEAMTSTAASSLSALLRRHPGLACEAGVRAALLGVFLVTEFLEPFHRVIQAEEAWLYRNPRTDSYVPTRMLWVMVTAVPSCGVLAAHLLSRGGVRDVWQAALAVTLLMPLNGAVTNLIKLGVGRPRPDFLQR